MDITILCTSLLLLISLPSGQGNFLLQIETHPQDQQANIADIVTFFCNATGNPPIMYQWFRNNEEISSLSSNTTTLMLSAEDNSFGSFHCNATSGSEEVASNSATLTVSPFGSVSILTSNLPVLTNFGSNVSKSCIADGGPNNTFEWTNDQGEVVSNSSQLQLTSITGSDAGTYTCNVTNAAGSGADEVTVTVAPYDVMIMGVNLYNQGEQLQLNCSAEGGPDLEYTWLLSGSMILNANNSTLVINNVNTTNGGDYTCNVTNDAGNDADNITVYIAPYNVIIMGENLYNQGEQLQLNCSSEGGPELNYSWLFEGNTIANTSILDIDVVNATNGGDYTCNVTNAAGANSNNVTVYIAPYDVIIMGENLYNQGEQLQLNCSAEGGPDLEYTWLLSGSLIPDASNSTLVINNVNTTNGGEYTCIVTNDAGNDTESITVYIAPYDVMIMGDNLYNQGDSLMLNCLSEGGPELEYTWLFAGSMIANSNTLVIDDVNTTNGGDYTCNVTNAAGYQDSSITVYIAPYNVMIMGENLYNQGNSLMLNCSSEGGPELEYTWLFAGSMIANTNTLVIDDVNTTHGGDYTCNVTNAAGYQNNNITVYIAPYDATITETVDSNTVTYTCNAEGGPGNTYEWLRLRDNETVSVTQELTLDNTDPLDGGDYQCTITNTAGNTSAVTTLNVATMIVNSPQTQNVTAGESFTLLCNATGYPVPSIEWTLNGTSYIIEDPSIVTIMPTAGLRSNSSNLTVTSAMTNDTGIYECVATNVVNNDTQDADVTVQNCPDEPINIQIFDVDSRSLTINWTEPHDNNDPITQYSISYQNPDCLVDANNVTQNVTVTSMEEQVMIIDLHPGEYYTFTIIAINDICPSQPSLPTSMRTLEEVPGTAPVVSANPDQRSINVSWMMLECQDRRGNITMYEVRYTSTAFWDSVNRTLNTSSGDGLNLEVDGLEEFLNYTIEVRAYTAIGPGPYSDPMNVQTLPDIPNGPVTNLSPVNVTATSVELSWGPVDEREENGIIQSYNIYYQLNESSDPYLMISVTGRNRNISDLMENEVYIFTVTAVNQAGESMVNTSVMVQTNESAPSTPPSNVVISNVTDGDNIAVNITWDPPNDPNGIIRYYRVEFVEVSDPLNDDDGLGKRDLPLDNMVMNVFVNITSGSSGAPTSVTLSELAAYRMYNYSIFSATSVDEGPSADGSFFTREDTPLAPQNLTVSIPEVARNSTTLLVNWERPLCDRGILSGYELCYTYVESSVGDCDSNGITVNITDPDQLSYTINDLSINTNYIVEVRGRTGAGLGDPASANGTTDEDAPDPVTNIVVQFFPNNTIRGYYNITWTPPAPINGSFYQLLEYSYSSTYSVGPTYNGAFNITLDQSQNYYVFDALYYTDYSFNITTINVKYAIDNGISRFTNQSSPAVPTAVRDIRTVMSTFESLYITWDHPEYPNSQLLNYTFYYNDNPAMLRSGNEISPNGFENVTLEIVTSYNLTGLSPFTNYTILITVTGRDVGNAPFEVELLQRTNTTVPVDLPTPPSGVPTMPPSFGTISVVLPQLDDVNTGELYLYAVVAVTGSELDNSPVSIITANDGNLPPPFPGRNNAYTAAVYTRPEDVPTAFVLGDDTTTTGPDGRVYSNRRLNSDTMYGVFNYIRLESDSGVADEGPLIVPSEYIALESTTASQEDDDDDDDDDSDVGLAVGVAIASIFVVLVVGTGIGIIAYQRWQHHHRKAYYNGEVAYTGSDGVVQNKAYVSSRQYQVEFKATSTPDLDKIDVNPLVNDPDGDQNHSHSDQDGDNDDIRPDDDGQEETEFNS